MIEFAVRDKPLRAGPCAWTAGVALVAMLGMQINPTDARAAGVPLLRAGYLTNRPTPVSEDLASAYRAIGAIFASGDLAAGADVLAMNFLMDRDDAGWARDLARLKEQVGECDNTAPLAPSGALSAEFTWRCAQGRVAGSVLLAPTRPPRIQSLHLARRSP